jgi:hypothetical protein
MTDREAMQQALDALDTARPACFADNTLEAIDNAITALRSRLAQPEFPTHEEGEDGWSEWVCPDPDGYLMKCCDCGLVHEAEFGVVRYKSETEREDCEPVDDPNLQAVFRMRRNEQWSPKDTAYRPGGLAQPEREPVVYEDLATELFVIAQTSPADDGFSFTIERIESWLREHFSTPPQRKPLTEEEIEDEWERITGHSIFGGNRAEGRTMYISPDEVIEFARAIEANLKEKNT